MIFLLKNTSITLPKSRLNYKAQLVTQIILLIKAVLSLVSLEVFVLTPTISKSLTVASCNHLDVSGDLLSGVFAELLSMIIANCSTRVEGELE